MDELINQKPVCGWVSVKDGFPKALQTVWLANGKGWCALGCLVEDSEGWHWALSNGIIYIENGEIVTECESDDLDVSFWHELPKPPTIETSITEIQQDAKQAVVGDGFAGSSFIDAGSKDGIQITLGCITPEVRDLLDTIMVEWEKHYVAMKESNPNHEPSYYGFAYWLVRWSSRVQSLYCKSDTKLIDWKK